MSDQDTKLDTKGLDKLIKAFASSKMQTHVGVLGKNQTRKDGGSNAEIGAKHEFGSAEVPQRSWLRVPLTDYLFKALEAAGAFDKNQLKKILKLGTFRPYYEKVGIVAESVIQEGFNSGGYGKWARWRKGYSSQTGNILVDTQQLRNSISSEVVEDK